MSRTTSSQIECACIRTQGGHGCWASAVRDVAIHGYPTITLTRARLPRARGPEALGAHSDEVIWVGGLQVLCHLPHPALRARRTVPLCTHASAAALRPLSSLAGSRLQESMDLRLPYQQHLAQGPLCCHQLVSAA